MFFGVIPRESIYNGKVFAWSGNDEDIRKLMSRITAARQWNYDHPDQSAPVGTLRHMMEWGVTFFLNPRKKPIHKAINSKHVFFLAGSKFDQIMSLLES